MIRSQAGVSTTQVYQTLSKFPGEAVYQSISHIEFYYPRLHSWYFHRVIPDVFAGKRRIFVRLSCCGIAGLAIAKRGVENKLCTLWVHPESRARGIAMDLAQEAFDWMKDDHPLFTVPEERILEFRCLLDRWDFRQTGEVRSAYRPGRSEFIFNGALP